MAAPTKQGIDYFPYDADLDQDDKLGMIVGEFGEKGERLWIKMLAWTYKNEGYYFEYKEDVQLRFLRRYAYCGFSMSFVHEVVPRFIRWGLFDKSVFDAFQLLTSVRIQKTWLDATRKRKGRKIDERIWLLGVNDANIPVITPEKAAITDKRKESKVKKRKSISGASPPATKKVIDYWDKLVEAWHNFYGKHFKNQDGTPAKPIFNAVQGAHLKKICEHLKKISIDAAKEWTEKYAVYCLNGFLQKAWDHDQWLKNNFELANLLSKINSITNKIINGNDNTKSITGAGKSAGALKLAHALASQSEGLNN